MNTMDELTTWLRARLDEDERIALATQDVNVRAGIKRGTPVPRWAFSAGEIRDAEAGVLRVKFTWPGEAAHITRHDPARVLREVAAKRRIIDEYEAAEARAEFPDRLGGISEGLYTAVSLLALPYADRGGYKESWRP